MTIEQMKMRIFEVYPGPAWKAKVQEMANDQIIALYYSLVKRGKIK